VFWSSRVRASRLPRRLLIVAAAAVIPAVAGCEAGDGAPTLDWHQPTIGSQAQAQGIAIRNVFVLGAVPPARVPAGQSASLFFALVNSGRPDRLLSVSAPGVATSVTLPGGSIRLNTAHAVLLTGPRPRALLTGLTGPLSSGTTISLTLTFQNAGTVHMLVPVLAQVQEYGTFSPAPPPTPTPSPSTPAHRRRHRTPSPGVSGATTSPTPTPSPTA
jgi:copper(I)-binding protein